MYKNKRHTGKQVSKVSKVQQNLIKTYIAGRLTKTSCDAKVKHSEIK